jgi:hypothetical protein
VQCPECGATYSDAADSCGARFNALLSLDHSRQEPWGSRHGQAFAAFALQHPTQFAMSLNHAWIALHRIYVSGDRPLWVFDQLMNNRDRVPRAWNVPTRPQRPVAPPAVTIADLGDFAAEAYAAGLDAWCHATLAMWGADARSSR